jgi:hypothetical protein
VRVLVTVELPEVVMELIGVREVEGDKVLVREAVEERVGEVVPEPVRDPETVALTVPLPDGVLLAELERDDDTVAVPVRDPLADPLTVGVPDVVRELLGDPLLVLEPVPVRELVEVAELVRVAVAVAELLAVEELLAVPVLVLDVVAVAELERELVGVFEFVADDELDLDADIVRVLIGDPDVVLLTVAEAEELRVEVLVFEPEAELVSLLVAVAVLELVGVAVEVRELVPLRLLFGDALDVRVEKELRDAVSEEREETVGLADIDDERLAVAVSVLNMAIAASSRSRDTEWVSIYNVRDVESSSPGSSGELNTRLERLMRARSLVSILDIYIIQIYFPNFRPMHCNIIYKNVSIFVSYVIVYV